MRRWAEDVQNTLNNETYDLRPTVRPTPSIYRVPYFLRNVKCEAYTPQLLSIGPFHYGSQKLQSMENYKIKCLKYFMEQHIVRMDILEPYVTERETEVRNSYAEAIPIESNDFLKMILYDASFIIVLFLKKWSHLYATIIQIPPWMDDRIQLDLILMENQLPFPFIKQLYHRFVCDCQSRFPTFMELTVDYFACFNTQQFPHIGFWDIEHFTDLLRHFYLPPRRFGTILPPRSTEVQEMFCASKLADSGVKFKPSSSSTACRLHIKYSPGVLEIPKFNLNNDTEICDWNVVALEQCHYREFAYVTDYFFMLSYLIHSRSDTDLLHRERIIEKRPIDNIIMATLPNEICTNISCRNINKEYHDICEDLTKFYHERRYYVLRSALTKDYFNTPWMGVASFGAIILLLFTLVQTVCSVLQTYMQF